MFARGVSEEHRAEGRGFKFKIVGANGITMGGWNYFIRGIFENENENNLSRREKKERPRGRSY